MAVGESSEAAAQNNAAVVRYRASAGKRKQDIAHTEVDSVCGKVGGPYGAVNTFWTGGLLVALIVLSYPHFFDGTSKVVNAYKYIGPDPVWFPDDEVSLSSVSIWFTSSLLLACYILRSLSCPGDDKSGAKGFPDDVASVNRAVQRQLRIAIVLECVWHVLLSRVNSDNRYVRLGGHDFELVVWQLSACGMLMVGIADAYYAILNSVCQALRQCKKNKTGEIAFAFAGIFFKAGLVTMSAAAMPNYWMIDFTERLDRTSAGRNLMLQTTAVATLFFIGLVILYLFCTSDGDVSYKIWPMHLAIGVVVSTNLAWLFDGTNGSCGTWSMLSYLYSPPTRDGSECEVFVRIYQVLSIAVVVVCSYFCVRGLVTSCSLIS